MDSASLMRFSLNQMFCDISLVNIHIEVYKHVSIEHCSIILQMAK